ncbi:hypothetical protein TanjilG_14908 [Lupinus angustifolius]|uniref:Chaperone DnaJ C-terminal domain-containing protein n=1 Tax=Lupinus angustifolius TaxID=3871 RepID=A0A1J7G779_LUPAN|nr:hypothetical protein TanjilG_14908 [Lupinus angustifolius]
MSTLEISAPELLPAPAASPPTKDHVHEIISKSSDKETEKIPSVSLSSNLSRRATTPIIFSQTTARRKPPEVEKKLFCSLEDLCFGCTKKIKVTRDVIKYPGVILQEEEILKIEIQPGWRKGTKITFEGKGDEKPGFLPGDIVFVIDEKKHPLYTRNGNNLEIGVEIPLADALTGCSIPIPLLGGKNMTLLLDNIVIYHGYEKVIEGQGMPIPKSKGTRGDLLVKFLIHFPTHLSDEQRQEAFCIPNALNVISNFPFLVIGLIGLILCHHGNYFQLSLQGELWGWTCFYVGVAAVGVGSSYYHLQPDDARLVWDRLPMTIAFTSIVAIFIIERIDERKGMISIIPLVLVGIISIVFFDDLRPYALVQFVPCIAIPLMAILLPPMYTHSTYWLWAAGFYLLAKVLEATDKDIYEWTHDIVSGHTLKHLFAAMVPVFLTLMLAKRSVEAERQSLLKTWRVSWTKVKEGNSNVESYAFFYSNVPQVEEPK